MAKKAIRKAKKAEVSYPEPALRSVTQAKNNLDTDQLFFQPKHPSPPDCPFRDLFNRAHLSAKQRSPTSNTFKSPFCLCLISVGYSDHPPTSDRNNAIKLAPAAEASGIDKLSSMRRLNNSANAPKHAAAIDIQNPDHIGIS